MTVPKLAHLTEKTLEQFDMLDGVLAAAGIPVRIDRPRSTETTVAVVTAPECPPGTAVGLLRHVATVFTAIADVCDPPPKGG